MSLLGHNKRTVKSWKAAPEEMSLEATAKDGQWRCWRDVLWKTVPDTRGGDRKRSVTDGWQPRTADNQWRCRGGMQMTSSNYMMQARASKMSTEYFPEFNIFTEQHVSFMSTWYMFFVMWCIKNTVKQSCWWCYDSVVHPTEILMLITFLQLCCLFSSTTCTTFLLQKLSHNGCCFVCAIELVLRYVNRPAKQSICRNAELHIFVCKSWSSWKNKL